MNEKHESIDVNEVDLEAVTDALTVATSEGEETPVAVAHTDSHIDSHFDGHGDI
jgi:hypothetical protein